MHPSSPSPLDPPSTGFGPEPGCSPSWLGSVGNGFTEPDGGRNGRVMAHRSSRCTACWSSTRTACRSSPAPCFHPRAGLPAHRDSCHAQRASRPVTGLLTVMPALQPPVVVLAVSEVRAVSQHWEDVCAAASQNDVGRCESERSDNGWPHRCRSTARRSRVASNEGTGGG